MASVVMVIVIVIVYLMRAQVIAPGTQAYLVVVLQIAVWNSPPFSTFDRELFVPLSPRSPRGPVCLIVLVHATPYKSTPCHPTFTRMGCLVV